LLNGSRNGRRSGAQTLLLLATPLSSAILRLLADGTVQQAELRRSTGAPAQTTLRAQLKKLVDVGAIDKRRRNRFPGVLEYELTAAGRDLLFVADVLERWLSLAPDGPLALDSSAAKTAIKALAEGWSATMLRALAASPLSLTQLDGVIASLSYPALERRLAVLRLAGLIEASPIPAKGIPYAVTGWLRTGVAPLVAAARWERRHAAATAPPIGPLDAEAAFMLTVRMLRPPPGVGGSCRLAMEIPHRDGRRLAGVVLRVRDSGIESCSANLDGNFDAWALGPPAAWLNAMIEGDAPNLELGGDRAFVRALIDGLHQVLFGTDSVPALDSNRSIEEDRSN
jgi:DNA-binding HxlR family transcriptional regulator